jgi:hypothetical protein
LKGNSLFLERVIVKSITLVCCLVISACGVLSAQNVRGAISGAVVDSNRKPVAGAAIEILDEETGQKRSTVTAADGFFQVSQLPASEYRVAINANGQAPHEEALTLSVNQAIRLEVQLAAGRRDTVQIAAGREVLKTESASMGAVVDNRLVRGLPLDGRNFFELALLVPGASPSAQGSAGSVRGDFAIHLNGVREDSNLFLLDGVYNADPKLNGLSVGPPVDGIREFEVLTSTYDASFGRNAGAQVNVITKSGTNQFHGVVYEFFRNAGMDARNFFAPPDAGKPAYQRNQFGANLGGPIARNRTFFFVDYEGRRVKEGLTRVTRVPTLAERNGDFSQSFSRPVDPFSQQPFPGNQIPAQFQHPIGRAIASLYPLPNRQDPVQNYVSSPELQDRADQFDVRVDHLMRRSELSFRYSFIDRDLFEPFAGPSYSSVPGYGNDVPRRAQNVMLSHTSTLSTTLLNEARVAFNRVAQGAYPEAGIRNGDVGLRQLWSNPRTEGLSLISLTGHSSLGHEINNPLFGASNTYQFIDQMTWTHGRHTLKFGGDIRHLQQNAFRDVLARGQLQFLGAFTFNPVADLLLGLPTATFGATLDNPQHLRAWSYNGFLNDTWRVRSNLTLTFGLRYEYNTPPVDSADRASLFNPATGAVAQVGTAGIPRSGFLPDRNNFGPRFGFAWTPKDGGTVIRGGYGMYFDQSALAPGEGLFFNPPYYDLKFYIPSAQQIIFLHDPFPTSAAAPAGTSLFTYQRDLRSPYVQHWNLNIQRQLGRSRVFEIGYVGSKGTKLYSGRDINQPEPRPGSFNLRPLPFYGDITQMESRGLSNYHSLQMRFQQTFQRGLSAIASYTYGKSIDDASGFFSSAGDPNFPQDSNNVRNERARSNFDLRQRLSLAYSYDLPFSKSENKLLRGWQTHGILTFQTGRPFTVALPREQDQSNTGFANLGFGANDRPNVVGNPKLSNPTPERWFDTSAFALQPQGTFGSAGRNIVDGPGLATANLSVIKDTAITERAVVQFRAEAFNLFNRVNFDLPDIFFGSPTFGRLQSAQNGRRVQLGLKLVF